MKCHSILLKKMIIKIIKALFYVLLNLPDFYEMDNSYNHRRCHSHWMRNCHMLLFKGAINFNKSITFALTFYIWKTTPWYSDMSSALMYSRPNKHT